MKLEKIYLNSIDRRINPVAVVSELNAELIHQEISEYVFTPQIYDYLFTVLDKVVNDKRSRTGIWVNGYYGSGKSHFLKYVYYTFSKEFKQNAMEHFKENLRNEKADITLSLAVTDAKLNDVYRKLDTSEVNTIMFNIDAVSGDSTNKEAITKIFLNQLNLSQGYNSSYIALAKLEKLLTKEGKFEEFKKTISFQLGEDWSAKSSDLAEAFLEDVLNLAKNLIGIDEKSFRASIERAMGGKEELKVVDLVQELMDYLAYKPENYKLVFLIDEVSQYIGNSSNLLLNLQSIVEEIGSKCGNKVWVICTAQQEIQDFIVGAGKNPTDFGKIMARFETRISLQSQNYSDIIKKRILDKNSDGVAELSAYFEKNKNIITNQFVAMHSLYSTFDGKESFIDYYPFIPYHFRLISDVIDSFSSQGFVTQGVKNTERSLLGVTHFTAKECKNEDVGYIVPFDGFFNSQLMQNLTNFATNKLDRAYSVAPEMKEKFSKRVIHALFMLSYLKENFQKNIPASLDNLVFLLMDKIDQDKLDLQKRTIEVLETLQNNAIIIKSESATFRFLGDDEVIVLKDIQSTKVSTDTYLERFFRDVLEKILNINKKVSYDSNNYDAQIEIDSKEMSGKGDFSILFAFTDTTEPEQLILQTASNNLVICLNKSLQEIRKDFTEYVQIDSYIRNNSDTSNKQRIETLQQFRQQADSNLSEIIKKVEIKFLQTSFISNGQIISSSSVNGSNPKARFQNMLLYHLEQVYKKKEMANSYAQTEDSFRISAQSKQLTTDNTLSDAEREVNQVLDMMPSPVVLSEIINKFRQPPYGWKDIAVMDVIMQLAKKNKRKFTLLSEPLDIKDYGIKALNSRERTKIEIFAEDIIDRNTLYNVAQSVNTSFNQFILDTAESDANIMFKALSESLKKMTDISEEYLNDNASFPFFTQLKEYHSTVKKFSERRDKMVLFDELINGHDEIKAISDSFKILKEFIDEKITDYKKIKNFTDLHLGNFSSLTIEEKIKGDKLVDYFQNDANPEEHFIEVKRIHQELNKAISELTKQLKEDLMVQYNNVFDRLELKQKEFGLDANILPDRTSRIEKFKKINSIAELKFEISNAAVYEQELTKILYAEKAKTDKEKGKTGRSITFISMVNDNGGSYEEIKSEEELDAFIKAFREKVLIQLKQNKIVGIK